MMDLDPGASLGGQDHCANGDKETADATSLEPPLPKSFLPGYERPGPKSKKKSFLLNLAKSNSNGNAQPEEGSSAEPDKSTENPEASDDEGASLASLLRRPGKKRKSSSSSTSRKRLNRILSDSELSGSETDKLSLKKKGKKLENGGDISAASRPLRTSFCQALARMSHLTEAPPALNYTDEELEKLKESVAKKDVKVNLLDVKSDVSLKELYEPAFEHYDKIGRFKPIVFPDPPGPVGKKRPRSYFKKKDFDVSKITEKLFHNHFKSTALHPLATTRSRAFVSGLLDEHRATCDRCDKSLKRLCIKTASLGTTEMMNNQRSQDITEASKLKILLAQKEKKIEALERRIETLLHDVKDDDLEPEEILGMLNGASEPSPSSTINKYSFANGYRLIDMKLLTTALQSSQKCPHGGLTVVELHKDMNPREDLTTRLAFMCTVCGPKTIFPTSSFSRIHPENFSVNKLLLPLLGPAAYFRLVEFLQFSSDGKDYFLTAQAQAVKPQMVVSLDNNIFSFRRPFEPPLPKDPDANICKQDSKVDDLTGVSSDGPPIKFRPFSELLKPKTTTTEAATTSAQSTAAVSNILMSTESSSNASTNVVTLPLQVPLRSLPIGQTLPTITLPVVQQIPVSTLGGTSTSLRISLPNNNLVHTVRLLPPVASPIRPRAPIATSVASQIRPLVPPVSPVINIRPVVATAVPSTQSVRGRPPKVAASIEVKKISPCSELPLGSRIQALKTGTKIVSNNIRYSTQSKTGLAPGVYRVLHNDHPERILVIKSESEISDNSDAKSAESGPSLPTIIDICSLSSTQEEVSSAHEETEKGHTKDDDEDGDSIAAETEDDDSNSCVKPINAQESSANTVNKSKPSRFVARANDRAAKRRSTQNGFAKNSELLPDEDESSEWDDDDSNDENWDP